MESTAFITGLPARLTSLKTRAADGHAGRRNRCPIRAIANQPPTPGEDFGDDGSLSRSRTAFENMLNLQLTPQGGKDGKCDCIWCEGTKKRKCSWCDGRGFREEMAQKSWEQLSIDIEKMQSEGGDPQFIEAPQRIPVQCSACSGSKKLRCGYCRGSGIGSYGHAH